MVQSRPYNSQIEVNFYTWAYTAVSTIIIAIEVISFAKVIDVMWLAC